MFGVEQTELPTLCGYQFLKKSSYYGYSDYLSEDASFVKVKHIIAKLAFSLAFLIFLEQVPAAALGRQVLVHEQFHLADFPTLLGSALFFRSI